jgi:hypothetical protein
MRLIFTTSCKPLSNDKIKIIQYNSINSWKWLDCEKEILVFNRDESIDKMCIDLGVQYVSLYESSDYSDLPTWRAMREGACKIASDGDLIVWVNSDIVFDNTIVTTINELKETGVEDFILTGKRKNWSDYWELKCKEDLGKIQFDKIGDKYEIDYFIYNKKHFDNLPKFFIARMKFDNYLMAKAINSVDKTIDSTLVINSYHHQHGYGQNLDKPYSTYLGDKEYQVDKTINDALFPISNIEDCRYKLKFEKNKIVL